MGDRPQRSQVQVPQLPGELVAQKQLLQMCPIGDGSPESEIFNIDNLKLIWSYEVQFGAMKYNLDP